MIMKGENPNPIESTDLVITNGAIGGNFLLSDILVDPGGHVIIVDSSYQQLSSVPNVFSNGNTTIFP